MADDSNGYPDGDDKVASSHATNQGPGKGSDAYDDMDGGKEPSSNVTDQGPGKDGGDAVQGGPDPEKG